MEKQTTYFMVRNAYERESPDWHHYFIVKAISPKVPEEIGRRNFVVVAAVRDERSLEAVKKLFLNSKMQQWVESFGAWPQIEGWH